MNLTVVGQGLTADRVDAMQAGLSVMGSAATSVIVTDTFSETVMELTGQPSHASGHGVPVSSRRGPSYRRSSYGSTRCHYPTAHLPPSLR